MTEFRERLGRLYLKAIIFLEKRAPGGYGFKSCRQITEMLSKGMEEKLSLSQRLALRFHFSYCRWCVRYGRQLKTLRMMARRPAETEEYAELSLSEEARRRILTAMKRSESQP